MIVTADDFGLAPEVNEAVEIACRVGTLSAASLMVAAPAAADAVARARRVPQLRVGLHLALTDATPALSPDKIPGLVDRSGRLRSDLPRFAVELTRYRRLRRQLAAEIEAQFLAYQTTGLPLDHVNAHQHFHVHPLVATIVLAIGRKFGMAALRVPYEPRQVIERIEQGRVDRLTSERVCASLLRLRALRAGLTVPDGVFGRRWSGALTPQRLLALTSHLPAGVWEIYFHPATSNDFPRHAPGYRYTEELAALTAPPFAEALRRSGRHLGGYADLRSGTVAHNPAAVLAPANRHR